VIHFAIGIRHLFTASLLRRLFSTMMEATLVLLVLLLVVEAAAAWGYYPPPSLLSHHHSSSRGRSSGRQQRSPAIVPRTSSRSFTQPSSRRLNQEHVVLISCHMWFPRNQQEAETKGVVEESSSTSFLIEKTTTATNDNNNSKNNDNNKFGFWQRIDSIKSGVVGAIAGSLASTILLAIHDDSIQQWEFDTDGAAVSSGLFAIVYRYCVRTDTNNPQLAQGVVGAFALTRTIARVHVPIATCTALPLTCGPPFGVLNWDLLWQLAWNGTESFVMFGSAAYALEYVTTQRGWISRFPG
jgi:hypothetical protein